MAKVKVSWIGNLHTRELHRVVGAGYSQPQGCQFSEIADARRVKFKTAKAALRGKPKYDACKYCNVAFQVAKVGDATDSGTNHRCAGLRPFA